MKILNRWTGEAMLELKSLRAADLRAANLRGADLRAADLRAADLNWASHDLVAEILRQHAGTDVARLMVAGLILIQRSWCWREFLALTHEQRGWALETLRPWHDLRPAAAPRALRAAYDAMEVL